MANLSLVGIALGVLASMSGTTGKQLMRFSEVRRRADESKIPCEAKAALILGVLINTVVGPLIDMASYAFAPQSVIAPLGALDVVWNTMSAPFTLHEPLTGLVILGCALVFGGAVTTSLVGSHHDEEYTMAEMEELFIDLNVLFYFAGLAAWLAFNVLVLMQRSASPAGDPWTTGDPIRGLSLGMTAGCLSGNMVFVKAFAEIVQGSISQQSGEYWTHWLTYALLVGAVFFAVSNLYFLTKAMREYEALFMGAVFEGSLIITASVSGCIVFNELNTMEAWQIGVYWLALLCILAGVFVVARDAGRKSHGTEEAASISLQAVDDAGDA